MDEQEVAVGQTTIDLDVEQVEAVTPIIDEMPSHWKIVRLGAVAKEFISGGTPSTKQPELWDGSIPWTTSAPIAENDITLNHAQRFITEQGLGESASHLVPQGNLLVGTRVGVGKAVVNLIDMAISQDLTGVVLDPAQVWVEYAAYQFKTMRVKAFFDTRKRGTTIKGVSRFDLQALSLYLCPLPEQQAIAHTLRIVQEAIQTRRQEADLECEHKAALMQHLFTFGTHGKPTKQTEIGEIPESWRVVQLGKVAKITSGGTPDRANPDFWNGGIPWVKTGEINYNIITSTEESISHVGLANSSAKITPAGTLLMAMYGQGVTRGRVAILGIDAALNQACAAISTTPDMETEYLFYFLAHSYESIRNLGHGANQKNLNAFLIKTIPVPVPYPDEQIDIAATLRASDTKITALEQEIELLEELFRALLEELMTGRLSVAPLVEAEVTG